MECFSQTTAMTVGGTLPGGPSLSYILKAANRLKVIARRRLLWLGNCFLPVARWA